MGCHGDGGDRYSDTVVHAVEWRTTLIIALTWTQALTISYQHTPSGRRRRTEETLQTRETDQNRQKRC